MKNYYSILQVSPKDSSEKIKKQYKKLSLKYHPDKIKKKSDESMQKFHLINEAYDVLKDDYKRGRYDVEYEKHFSFQNMFQHFTNTNFFNFGSNYDSVVDKNKKKSYTKSHYVQSVQKNGETFIKEKFVEKDHNGKINEKRNYRKIDRNGKEIKFLK